MWNRSWAQGTRKKKPQALWNLRPDQRRGGPRRHATVPMAAGSAVRTWAQTPLVWGYWACCWPCLVAHERLSSQSALQPAACWRMSACRLNRLRSGRRVGEWPGVGARCGCGGGLGVFGRLAVVRRHAVLRLTELVVVYLARPGSLGSRFGGLFSCFRRGGRQLGQRHRTQNTGAQRQQGRSEDLLHGALPHTCAGWPAVVAAASP